MSACWAIAAARTPLDWPQLGPKETSVNEYWQAIFLSNSAEPIDRVEINGRPLKLEK